MDPAVGLVSCWAFGPMGSILTSCFRSDDDYELWLGLAFSGSWGWVGVGDGPPRGEGAWNSSKTESPDSVRERQVGAQTTPVLNEAADWWRFSKSQQWNDRGRALTYSRVPKAFKHPGRFPLDALMLAVRLRIWSECGSLLVCVPQIRHRSPTDLMVSPITGRPTCSVK